jgi:hypothetical protein
MRIPESSLLFLFAILDKLLDSRFWIGNFLDNAALVQSILIYRPVVSARIKVRNELSLSCARTFSGDAHNASAHHPSIPL